MKMQTSKITSSFCFYSYIGTIKKLFLYLYLFLINEQSDNKFFSIYLVAYLIKKERKESTSTNQEKFEQANTRITEYIKS